MNKTELTAARLRLLLNYDPDTGWFTWRDSEGAKKKGTRAGSIRPHGYRSINISRRFYYAHRLAFLWMTDEWPTAQVDHINGRRDDNRWSNLRGATNSENGWNRRESKASRSGIKGVWWDGVNRRWQAQITCQGEKRHLGSFPTSRAATDAYVRAADELHKEFTPW